MPNLTVPGGAANFKDFAFICYGKDIPAVIENALRAEDNLRRNGYGPYADRLANAFDLFNTQIQKVGVQAAAVGTVTLREIEKRTRVRPAVRHAGHKSLSDSLYVRPLAIPGGIGIADYLVLERDVPWWVTNEVGSSARVGGVLFGTFSGGAPDSPPDPTQFREHALFDTMGNAPGRGVITNPIPARHFVQESIKIIDREWRVQYDRVVGDFNLRLQRIVADIDAEQKAARRAAGEVL